MQLFSLEDFGDVKIEKVAVKNCLDASGDDGNDVVESLVVVSVDPVEDVKTTV